MKVMVPDEARDHELYQAAIAVEQDQELNSEMTDWEATTIAD